MKAIIVDDEPNAIQLLSSYLSQFSRIELVGSFRNGIKALEFIQENKPDLIFLDINMPHINGISLAKIIDKSCKIIFTTAHSEHAVESYDIGSVDYLLKPISLERFTKAMGKILQLDEEIGKDNTPSRVLVKSGSKTYHLDPDKILYLSKDGNYICYFCEDKKKVLSRETTAEALAKLPSYFVQIHKSHIVNTNCIEFVDRDELCISGIKLPIGNSYKGNLISILGPS